LPRKKLRNVKTKKPPSAKVMVPKALRDSFTISPNKVCFLDYPESAKVLRELHGKRTGKEGLNGPEADDLRSHCFSPL
jgi:hypothetical protein